MLKGIPRILSPEMLKILCEMGHGDNVVIADGNFPAEAIGKGNKVLRCDGHGTLEILAAILQLIPLDASVNAPVVLMKVSENDKIEVPIIEKYKEIISQFDNRGESIIEMLERHKFYDEAVKAYLIIATGETALYANIMVRKGVISE